jgi:hypothetical protein
MEPAYFSGIALGYALDDSSFDSRHHRVQTGVPIQCVPRDLSLGEVLGVDGKVIEWIFWK